MDLRNIVAATDESDAGRQAVRTALDLGSRCSARVTVMRVVAVEAAPRFAGVAEGTGFVAAPDEAPELERLHRWLRAGVLPEDQIGRVQLGVAFGIPGIEICRYADENEADLVVLGRKRHSPMMRLLLGDTADAVARRSRSPSLFVQPGAPSLRKMLVALDGSDRGMIVLHQACDLAHQVGASLQAITVEGGHPAEPLHLVASLPLARSASLQARVREVLSRKALPDMPLVIRRGDILERVIAEAQETGADVLVVGYHRGGPPGVLEAGSIARRLAHASPCAVLTVPL
jgi:nucleotide-binding universal stress UspA family protein